MKKQDSIEKMRSKLNKIANCENLLDKEVIELSQKLDKEIVKFYKEQENLKQEEDACQQKFCQ